MKSLKAALPKLADIMGSTPSALYERQRALARLGLLSAVAGRGPGSGAPLSADNVAALLIALAVTDNLSDTDKRVQRICRATPLLKTACPFTGAPTFHGALSAVLSSVEKAAIVEYASVDRADLTARIGYRQHRRSTASSFRVDHKKPIVWPAITTTAMISEAAIRATSLLLKDALSSADEEDAR